jgi:acetylornithine deacetylase
VIDLLAQWLAGAGFRIEVMEVRGRPDKANLIATLGMGPGGLVLAGHTDTVPYDEERWSYDPFRLTQDGGRLYGLGTCDMKSFLGIAIEAARGLSEKDLKRPLTILATADEESSMSGARALAEAGRPLGRYAVIGEPTGLKPVRLHKGVMGEAVRLVGRTGHASDPRLGRNALDGMQEVMGDIVAWRAELRERYRHPAFAVPGPTVNLGHIHGGDNPNRICGDCELHLDLRVLPGMSADDLRAELGERVALIAGRRGLEWEVEPLFKGIPPAETPEESAIVKAGESLTRHAAEAVGFGTEAPFFSRLGMETLILGPGDVAQAHQPDEYLEAARIPPTLELLRGLIRRFCQ